MTAVTIRPRTPADDARLVEIWNMVSPKFPAETVEDFRHELDSMPPSTLRHLVVAEDDSRIVATANLLQMFWVKERGAFMTSVTVDPVEQGHGIGSRLYEQLMSKSTELGAIRLYGHYLENNTRAKQFADRRGFQKNGRVHRMSRLEVRSANLEGYDGIEERLAGEGIRLTTLAKEGPDNEQFLRAVHELQEATEKDMPSAEEPGEMPFEDWRKLNTEGPGKSPESLLLAVLDGSPVGIAIVKKQGTSAWNWYTGVDRSVRGKGVARGLKLKTLEWARREGVDYIYTGNDVDNSRMLDVNVRLGYRPIPSWVEVVKSLVPPDDLPQVEGDRP